MTNVYYRYHFPARGTVSKNDMTRMTVGGNINEIGDLSDFGSDVCKVMTYDNEENQDNFLSMFPLSGDRYFELEFSHMHFDVNENGNITGFTVDTNSPLAEGQEQEFGKYLSQSISGVLEGDHTGWEFLFPNAPYHVELSMPEDAKAQFTETIADFPEELYHITTFDHLESIAKEGLIPRYGEHAHKMSNDWVHFTDYDNIDNWMSKLTGKSDTPVILIARSEDIPGLTNGRDLASSDGYECRTPERVPVSAIRLADLTHDIFGQNLTDSQHEFYKALENAAPEEAKEDSFCMETVAKVMDELDFNRAVGEMSQDDGQKL